MFGGLIEVRGTVVANGSNRARSRAGSLKVRVPGRTAGRVKAGDSVAINGVCLTVTSRRGDLLSFDVGPETLKKTTAGSLRNGERVHVELALRWGQRIGGHYVLGHVEGVGRVVRVRLEGRCRSFEVRCPGRLSRWVVPKGSIALDGVSLTCGRRRGDVFSVHCIPATLTKTGLGDWRVGTRVNIETDYLLRAPRRSRRGRSGSR